MGSATLSAEQQEFQEYARSWLAENGPPTPPERMPITPLEVMTTGQRDYLQAWQHKCYEAGLVGADYPTEYGGGGREGFQRIANMEMGRAGVPFLINVVGLNMAAPTILVHGTEEQKKKFIPGYGHPYYFPTDPRSDRIFQIANEGGVGGESGRRRTVEQALEVEVARGEVEVEGRGITRQVDGAVEAERAAGDEVGGTGEPQAVGVQGGGEGVE